MGILIDIEIHSVRKNVSIILILHYNITKTNIIIAHGDTFFFTRIIPQLKLDALNFLAMYWQWVLYYKRFKKRIWNN